MWEVALLVVWVCKCCATCVIIAENYILHGKAFFFFLKCKISDKNIAYYVSELMSALTCWHSRCWKQSIINNQYVETEYPFSKAENFQRRGTERNSGIFCIFDYFTWPFLNVFATFQSRYKPCCCRNKKKMNWFLNNLRYKEKNTLIWLNTDMRDTSRYVNLCEWLSYCQEQAIRVYKDVSVAATPRARPNLAERDFATRWLNSNKGGYKNNAESRREVGSALI